MRSPFFLLPPALPKNDEDNNTNSSTNDFLLARTDEPQRLPKPMESSNTTGAACVLRRDYAPSKPEGESRDDAAADPRAVLK